MTEEATPQTTTEFGFVSKLSDHRPVSDDSQYAAVADDLYNWIDASYEQWVNDPKDWRIIEFDTAMDADSAEEAGKWAARTRPAGELSFIRKQVDEDNVLVYRVRDKINRGRKPSAKPAANAAPAS